MSTWIIVLLVVLAIVLILLVALTVYGSKLQKKSNTQQAELKASAQTTSILVIDKKRMKLKDANLPKIVLDQTPKYLRGSKVPIVKAKIGPKVMTLMCDEKVFELIPIKQEVKAVISGIYIMDVKGPRNNLSAPVKKEGFFKRMTGRISKPKKSLNSK